MFVVAMILYILAVVIGLILIIVPGIYLLVRFAFVPTAMIIEKSPLGAAFSRSSQLVAGNWWRVFGYGLIVFILIAAVQAVANAIHGPGGIIAWVIEVAVQPFTYGMLTLLYFELRTERGETIERATPDTPVFA
jgi:hypothetical protein